MGGIAISRVGYTHGPYADTNLFGPYITVLFHSRYFEHLSKIYNPNLLFIGSLCVELA